MAVAIVALTASGAHRKAERGTGSATLEYRNVQGAALHAHVFAARTGEAAHPAILFFFGGGWSSDSPTQFYPFAAHLAGLGFVAIAVE